MNIHISKLATYEERKNMRVFIISSVRNATDAHRAKLEEYAERLEGNGVHVYLPHRDTNQNTRGINICNNNTKAIWKSDEVHVFYDGESQGIHFDLGVAFAFDKPIVVVENEKYNNDVIKSFPKFLDEWGSINKGIIT